METIALFFWFSHCQSNGEIVHDSLESQGVKTFLKRLINIFKYLSADVVDLVKTLDSVLNDFSY